jgi:hypothetical protein
VIKNVVPPHIEHRFSKEMAEKSEIINMPVVPFNQNKTSDICRYMEYVTDFLYNIYRGLNADDTTDLDGSDETSSLADVAAKKSEVLQDVKVPLVGDLLGRERLTGAKKTRAGCDHSADRFEQIVELPAVWHAKQFFLSVSEVFGARAKSTQSDLYRFFFNFLIFLNFHIDYMEQFVHSKKRKRCWYDVLFSSEARQKERIQ